MSDHLARQQRTILLTTDRDFKALPDIRCEDWINEPAQKKAQPKWPGYKELVICCSP